MLNNLIIATLFQRCFVNIETISMRVRHFNFHFQRNINVDVLKYKESIKIKISHIIHQKIYVCYKIKYFVNQSCFKQFLNYS